MMPDNIVINEKTFYYDAKELELTDEIIQILSEFNGEDDAYTVYMDETAGLIVY
jgi:hypothetical protein